MKTPFGSTKLSRKLLKLDDCRLRSGEPLLQDALGRREHDDAVVVVGEPALLVQLLAVFLLNAAESQS